MLPVDYLAGSVVCNQHPRLELNVVVTACADAARTGVENRFERCLAVMCARSKKS